MDEIKFIGVGVEKCGTSWTWRNLKSHPELCPPKKKPYYFSNPKLTPITEYLSDFPKMGKLYADYDERAFVHDYSRDRIYKNFPAAKLLIILRQPADRAWSHYKHALCANNLWPEDMPFKEVWSSKPWLDGLYIEKGLYYTNLLKWYEVFSRDQIKVMIYDDLVKKPISFLKEIYSWLNIESKFISNFVYDWIKRDYNQKYDIVPFKDRSWVTNHYLLEIRNLEKLLNRNLSVWKI